MSPRIVQALEAKGYRITGTTIVRETACRLCDPDGMRRETHTVTCCGSMDCTCYGQGGVVSLLNEEYCRCERGERARKASAAQYKAARQARFEGDW